MRRKDLAIDKHLKFIDFLFALQVIGPRVGVAHVLHTFAHGWPFRLTEHHTLMGGKLHVYKRPGSRFWQCSAYFKKNRRKSTGEESLSHAIDLAEDWYTELRAKNRSGELDAGREPRLPRQGKGKRKGDKTFADAAMQFLREYPVITQGHRSPQYVQNLSDTIRVHLLPYFGIKALWEITPGLVQEYRIHRIENSRTAKPPARSTMSQDMVALRQVLKTAYRHGWLLFVPDLSQPYKTAGKVGHRAWFSPDEYERLYEATRKRARKHANKRWRAMCEDLHDYVLFMANTGLRPDEANQLQDRDVTIIDDDATGKRILEIEVRGKRGVGWCKSMPGAVLPLERLRQRNSPKQDDLLFPRDQRTLFNDILDELKLKKDRDGNARTFYSLRHTYICLRLIEGADIYQIAKNCRTSVEMIEKHYAVHLKHTLDSAAINVRKPRSSTLAKQIRNHKRKRKQNPVGEEA